MAVLHPKTRTELIVLSLFNLFKHIFVKMNRTYQFNEAISTLEDFIKVVIKKGDAFQKNQAHRFFLKLFRYVYVVGITHGPG